MTLREKIEQFTDDFNSLGAWDARFDYLIQLSDEIREVPQVLFIPENRITGCQSRTYFMCRYLDGKACIDGYSNAAIPGGLAVMLKNIFEGHTREEIREVLLYSDVKFWDSTELTTHLTPARAGALGQMIDRLMS